MTKPINLKTKEEVRFFGIAEDGSIDSCITEARTLEEAWNQDAVGSEAIIKITESNLDFIVAQFGYMLTRQKDK